MSVAVTPGRVPTIAFSDDADYDGIATLLLRADFMWQVVMKDGTVHEAGRTTSADDGVLFQPYGEDVEPHGEPFYLPFDDIARFVYL